MREGPRGLRHVARQSLLYGLGSLGTSLVTLLLIPVITRRLSTADYGVLSLVEATVGVAALVLSLGLDASLMRYFFLYSSEVEKRQAVSSIFLASLVPVILVFLPVVLGRGFLARMLFCDERFSPVILLAFGITAGMILCQMGLGYVRSREQALAYGALNGTRLLLYALLVCVAIWLYSWGVRGVLKASLVAQGLVGITCLLWMLRQVGIRPAWEKIQRGLRYGLPLVPSGLALWVVAQSDRYFLTRYNDLAAVGVYSLGYHLGTAPMFAFSAFQLAWPQFAFQTALDPEAGRTYARLTRYAAVGGGMAFLGLSLFAREWVGLLAGEAFQAAWRIIPVVALAHLAYAAYFLFATGITIKEKTAWLPLVTGLAAIVNLAGNFLLIPRFGPMGAAWATLLGYLILALLTFGFSTHYLPVPYEFGKMGKVGGVVLGICLSTLVFSSLPYGMNLGSRVVLLLAYPLLMVPVGGISREELSRAFSVFRHRFPSK